MEKIKGVLRPSRAHPFQQPPSRSSPLPAPEPSPQFTRQGESTNSEIKPVRGGERCNPQARLPGSGWGHVVGAPPHPPAQQTSAPSRDKPQGCSSFSAPPAHRGLTNTRYCLNRLSALRRSKTQSVKHRGPHMAHSPAPGEHRRSAARGLQGTKTTPHR